MSAAGNKRIAPQGQAGSQETLLCCSPEVTVTLGGGLVIPPFSKCGNSGVEGGLVTCLMLSRINDRDMVFKLRAFYTK